MTDDFFSHYHHVFVTKSYLIDWTINKLNCDDKISIQCILLLFQVRSEESLLAPEKSSKIARWVR